MIKVQAGNTIKKVNLGTQSTFQSLLEGVRKVFKGLPEQFQFYYHDEDNEKIQVNNTYDLEIFLNSEKKAKLFIQLNREVIVFNQSLLLLQVSAIIPRENDSPEQQQQNSLTSLEQKKENEISNFKKQDQPNNEVPQATQILQKCLQCNLEKENNLQKSLQSSDKQLTIIDDTNSSQKQSLVCVQNSLQIKQLNYLNSIYQLFDPNRQLEQNQELMKYPIRQRDIQDSSLVAVMTIWESSKTLAKQLADQFQNWQKKQNK